MEYKSYSLRERNDGQFQTKKARPYDNAEYYWGLSKDKNTWKIVYKGKVVQVLIGTFEQCVDALVERNQEIVPRICHN